MFIRIIIKISTDDYYQMPIAVSLAMIKAFCPTNIFLDIIEKPFEELEVYSSAWQ